LFRYRNRSGALSVFVVVFARASAGEVVRHDHECLRDEVLIDGVASPAVDPNSWVGSMMFGRLAITSFRTSRCVIVYVFVSRDIHGPTRAEARG
jgi:hypothetical protein